MAFIAYLCVIISSILFMCAYVWFQTNVDKITQQLTPPAYTSQEATQQEYKSTYVPTSEILKKGVKLNNREE